MLSGEGGQWQIQYFGFGSRGELTGRNIVRRRSGGSELVLAPWEGSVTWRGVRGDVGWRRGDIGERKGRR
jgi:hypothetical protein